MRVRRISDDAAWVDSTTDRVVVMNLATAAQPLALLGTAAAAWRGLTGCQPNQPRPSVPELSLIELLADKYGAEAEAVSDDVVALLHRLEAEGLVEATQAG